MRDITPKHKFTKEFRITDDCFKEPGRDLTWYLNDFEWKKEPYYQPDQEPEPEIEMEEEADDEQ